MAISYGISARARDADDVALTAAVRHGSSDRRDKAGHDATTASLGYADAMKISTILDHIDTQPMTMAALTPVNFSVMSCCPALSPATACRGIGD